MDNCEAKYSKTARKKLRKKLLESKTKVESSNVSCISSDDTLITEKLIEGKGEKAKSKLLRKNRLKQRVSGTDVAGADQLIAAPKAETSLEGNKEKKKEKLSQRNREKRKVSGPDVDGINQLDAAGEDGSEKCDSEKLIEGKGEKSKRKRSRKDGLKQRASGVDITGIDQLDTECKAEKSLEGNQEKKKRKLSKKNRDRQKVNGPDIDGTDQLDAEGDDGSEKPDSGNSAMESSQSEISRTKNSARLQKADLPLNKRTKKLERSNKKKKDNILSGKVGEAITEDTGSGASEVYHISSVDTDSSKGMKKWINEYYQQRPGLKILQQRIDEFITTHEENEEQARKDKEALAAEDGWTVVVHQKGRKKTTEAESGTVVGSVAQAAVLGQRSQKKIKDFGVDFYRFQKREAQRNEIMVLQSKFEEDKKRIQQLRSARKFRPY